MGVTYVKDLQSPATSPMRTSRKVLLACIVTCAVAGVAFWTYLWLAFRGLPF